MKKIYILLFVVFLSACLPNGAQIPQSPALRLLERKSGLIAYIGNDGNVYVIDQSGASRFQLTNDITTKNQNAALYRLPTWSRDSSSLAFMRHERAGENLISEIFIARPKEETVQKIFSGYDFTIYLNWSPDNTHLGLLTSAPNGQNIIFQSLPIDNSEKKILDTGNPFYWSWAPDGKTMLVHKNGLAESPQQLAFLKDEAGEIIEFVLDAPPASFQAPAWSPSGEYILISTRSTDSTQQIILTDSSGANPQVIADVKLNAAFAWAPDSEQFAYILSDRQVQNGAFGTLHIGDVYGSPEIVIDEDVVGFFWSPDAKQVAYFVPLAYAPENADGAATGQETLYLSLKVLDASSGESQQVALYKPSEEFLSILPYIDQYHQSITIWSPDSNNLVVSFLDTEGTPGIAIVPASGITEPRFLAEGSFAVWSWK
jgi:Tol biopolymer transport system component